MLIPYKHWKLRSKILFAAVIPFLVSVILSVPFFTSKSLSNMETNAKAYVEELGYGASVSIKSEIDTAYIQGRMLSESVSSVINGESSDNLNVADLIIKKIVESNPLIQGAWLILDGRALDQKKIIYWNKISGQLKRQIIYDNSRFLEEKKYLKGIESVSSYMIEPQNIISSNNSSLIMTSIGFPISSAKGKKIGVVGIDLDISDLKLVVFDLVNYGVKDAAIIDDSSNYVIHTNSEFNGRKLDVDYQTLRLIQKNLASDKNYVFQNVDQITNQEMYKVYVPLKFENLSKIWSLYVSLPLDPIRNEVYKDLSLIMLVVVLCLSLGVSVSIVTAKNIANPIKDISEILSTISEGKTNATIPEIDSEDEIGEMVESAKIFRKHTEDLVEAKRVAVLANTSKTQFLANMSHELRTPMHAVLSYSKMGMEKIEDKQSKPYKYFQSIQQSGTRLLNLINNLLDLSKLESGVVEYNFSNENIVSIVEKSVAELQPLISEKEIKIIMNSNLQIKNAEIDHDKITQVIINIISNAIKFSPVKGEIEVVMDNVEYEENEKKFVGINISVMDDGVGIPENELESIFDKFVQSSKTNKGTGGTGLGLSIAKNIVMHHGGRIWAQNKAPNGACVNFTIPTNVNHKKLEVFNEE